MPDNCGGDALGAEQAPRRDETKRTQESEKMMLAMAEEAATLLKMVKVYPKMWEHESMKAVRNLAYEITGDPQKYRPETEEEGFGEGTECLTKDIGALLFGKQLSIMEAKTDPIYLQITHAESNSGSRDIAGTTVNVRKWKFMAVDGDGKSIVLEGACPSPDRSTKPGRSFPSQTPRRTPVHASCFCSTVCPRA